MTNADIESGDVQSANEPLQKPVTRDQPTASNPPKPDNALEDLFGEAPAPRPRVASTDDHAASEDFQQPQAGTVVFHSTKSDLRYEGKTFDQSRTEWRNELSTEKRLEAVKALSAFGANGYAKEAGEAILDVAGQYDFFVIADDEEGKLKETVIAVLAPYDGSQSLAPYWVPDLSRRLENDPKKWNGLAANLLSRLRTDDDQVVDMLQSLAESERAEVQSAALGALVRSSQWRSGEPKIDEKTRERLTRALQSKDLATVHSAISLLLYIRPTGGGFGPRPQLIYEPELFPLLFSR